MPKNQFRFVASLCVFAAAAGFLSLWQPGTAAVQPSPRPSSNQAARQNRQAGTAKVSPKAPRVVIVGAGIAGLSAALDLGRGGADVTVIDMSSVFGGHAVMSQGGLCLIDTPVQKAAGVKDSPDLAFADFMKWGEDPNKKWVRYYVDHSRREIYDWLVELGVQFDAEIGTAPGNSVDRFHQPTGRGVGMVTPLYRECLAHANVEFLWNRQAVGLLRTSGRVAGVLARDTRTGVEQKVAADAVILATGGFQSNLAMVRQYWPAEFKFPARILVGSGRNSVGHGHRLAESAGGALVKMDHQWNYFTGIPDPRYPNTKRGLSAENMYGIIVNPEGRRFANLHNWAKEVMPLMLRQRKATLWFIFDEASKPEFVVSGSDWADFKKVDRDILQNEKLVKKSDRLETLAGLAGLPPQALLATARRYNRLVEAGQDKDFNRFGPGRPSFSNKASPKLVTPPFYAMQAYPLTRKSMGGVAIDLNCRVLDRRGRPIPGLFAAGELTGLAGINGKAALEGTFLGPCILTGRVAARTILEKPPAKTSVIRQARAATCRSCHDVKSDLSKPRPGFWHYEKSHKVVLERKMDCRQCHADLAPYRETSHHINRQVLSTSCAGCHIGHE